VEEKIGRESQIFHVTPVALALNLVPGVEGLPESVGRPEAIGCSWSQIWIGLDENPLRER